MVQIVWGMDESQLPVPPPGSSCRMLSLRQVEMFGQEHTLSHIPPKPSDVATICYTSGTTGVPKGEDVELTVTLHSLCSGIWLLCCIKFDACSRED